ncbi:sucrase ferredoxin [Georgenia sp. 10Sc9-8]|uniref:Sucrase ferredoxin n=1 Tax=Georgenia halotolerans TaxID=3028317 RepID=A0ABT5U1Q2_9MICO|nr:sucrase ferredoxin [Georgenia halotolerans]
MISARDQACSRLSLEAGDPLAGTAATARGYLLIEHGGPWGVKPFQDAVFPDDAGAPTEAGPALQAALEPVGITPLLIRRRGARHGLPASPTVMLVALDEAGGTGARTTVRSVTDLLEWDLTGLVDVLRGGGVPAGWEPLATQYLVCTHARRDACCGELGRPLAAALDALVPEATWEVSHLGGHRLAANTLVVPDGVVYGRLTVPQAADLVRAHADGRVLVAAARGRAALPHSLQAAELAVRQAADAPAADAVRLAGTAVDGTRTISRWTVHGRRWEALVDTVPGQGLARPASCGKEPGPPPDRQVVVEVAEADGAGRRAAEWDAAHAGATELPDPHPEVVAAVGPLDPGAAVDLACGTGRNAVWLARQGWVVTGVDSSRVALARAEAEGRARGLQVTWELGDARLWSPPEPLDLVVLSFAHLPGVVRRAAGWLRPGGHLVLAGHARRNLTEGVGGPQDERLLHDPAELRREAEAAGLAVLRCTEVDRGEPSAIDAVLVARR